MADGSTRRERVRGLLDEEHRRIAVRAPRMWFRAEHVEATAGGDRTPYASRAAARHLTLLVERMRELLADESAPEELADLGLAVLSATDTLRAVPIRPAARRDVGVAGAHLGRCAAEALRAHATRAALPAGCSVPDVAPALLWFICDLSERLRVTGREGPLGRRWDAGVEARDAADLVVTTYRHWRPRLRGQQAEAVAHVAVTAAHTAVWCGFATLDLEDDDGCGRPVQPVPAPPERWAAAAAEPPTPLRDPVEAVAAH